MNADLLSLPWEIQVSLASGYAGYVIAYAGLREGRRTTDIVFITLIFGLLATGALAVAAHYELNVIAAGLAAFLLCVTSGILWRKWGRDILRRLLRHINVAWSNDDPSALATLSTNSVYPVKQIAVLLDDGTWLRCDDATKFNDAPFGPCLIGPNGDVALYLTHEERPGEEARELTTVSVPEWGDRITYVPASRIRRMTVRHLRRPRRS